MVTELKLMCLRSYKKHITLPKENWFSITENGAVLTYFMGKKMRFITFDSREEFAAFLEEQGYIECFEGSGKNIRLYEKTLFTIAGKDGVPVQWESRKELEWNHIKLYPSDAIHFASQREYELQSGLLGLLPKAKVRSIQPHSIRPAA